jgi:dTDP-4-amino-4,6-dideoxygalactose transaminase
MFDEYRAVYYSIMKRIQRDKQFWQLMFELQRLSKDTFIYKLEDNRHLATVLDNMELLSQERIVRANLYNQFLNREYISLPKIDNNCVRWRYSFLYYGNQKELLTKVRQQQVDISSWYPTLHQMYSKQDDKYFKNAIFITGHIINLWLEPKYSTEKITRDIRVINKMIVDKGEE